MSVTIRVKRGTATQWAARTTPLFSGEIGYDLTNKITKIGDGTSLWSSLPAISSDGNGSNTADFIFTDDIENGQSIISLPGDKQMRIEAGADSDLYLTAGDDLYIQTIGAGDDIHINAADDIRFSANNENSDTETVYYWRMDSEGHFQLPGDGYISNPIDSSGDPWSSFNDTMHLVPDGSIVSDQYIILDPTAPNHIHIRAGGNIDQSSADLFLGGERNNVRISDGGRNVSVSTRPQAVINTYTNINPTSDTSFVVSNTASIYLGDMVSAPGGDTVTVDSVTQDSPEIGLITVTANLNGTPAQFVGGAAHVFSHEVEWENNWVFGSNGVLSGPAMGGIPVYGLYNDAATESDLWISSSEKIIINGTNGEFLNDASIASNQIATMADITSANEYTDQAIASLGDSLPETYVPISDVGNPEGVASLDINGKIPDSEIPAEITRNTAVQTLTNKTIGLGTGITSAAGYDNISGFFGQSNIAIHQDGIDKGGRLNISSGGVITVANSGIGYTSGIVTTSGGTRIVITVGGNALSGTLAEFNAALTDGDFATESYVNTAVSNIVDAAPSTLNTLNEIAAAINDDASYAATITTALGNKLDSSTAASTYLTQSNASTTYAPIASPTFTGTVGGITKTMVGLGNVDNTSDVNKPVSTATQTALDLKLDLSSPAVDYYITNSGAGSYIVNGVSNGLITFEKGKKYRIHINASGHPFWIQTVSGAYSAGNVYSTGITNGGAQVGHILVELPQNAPDDLYYVCQYHSSMQGSISVQSQNTITINSKSSSYTILPVDSGKLIEMSAGGTLTITDSASFPVGYSIDVLQTGSSQVTIAGDGFTPNATPGLKLRTQWSSATLIKRALNSWVVLGDLSA